MFDLNFEDAAGLVLVLLVLWSLYRAHKDKNGLRNFSLFDLVTENGRVSRLATVYVGGTLLVSWVMVKLTLDGKMTEGYLGLYFTGVIAPIISKLFSAPPPPSTTTLSETKVITKEVKADGPTQT